MSFFKTKTGIVFIGFMLIAGYQLITEHGAHLAPYAPWLILLACPLMHIFMHHGHHGHTGSKHQNDGFHTQQSDEHPDAAIEQGGHYDEHRR